MQGRPILLYDGDCGFCRRWALWAKHRGADIEFTPCQEASILRHALGIADKRCQETAFYIDEDGVLTHAQAINAVLTQLPGPRNRRWRLLGRIGSIAPFWPLGALGYRVVAKNRHHLRGPKL